MPLVCIFRSVVSAGITMKSAAFYFKNNILKITHLQKLTVF